MPIDRLEELETAGEIGAAAPSHYATMGYNMQTRIPLEETTPTIIRNLKDEAVDVELYDSIPVSKTDRIQIKGIELTPHPTVKDFQKREGVMKWEIRLKPKAVQAINVKFFVKHPKARIPQGL